jgi:hypothetical protein
MLWWTCQLLRRAHPWPHRDCAGPGIADGRPRRGVAASAAVVVIGVVVLTFPLALTLAFAAVVGGGGKRGGVSEDSTVLAEVGVEEEEDALLLRVQIRTWRPVLGPPSCPVQSPRVQGCCRWCGRRGMTVSA